MRKLNKLAALGIASALCGSHVFAQDETNPKAENVPFYYKIADDDAMSDLNPGYIQLMTWPSESHISEARVDSSSPQVKRATELTYFWLKKVLRPEWLPNLERVELYPLKHEFDGWDVLRLRYRIGDYVFQVASLSYSTWISVAPYNKVAGDVSTDLETGKVFFAKMASKFFLRSDEFEAQYKFKPVQKKKSIININREGSGYWWDTLNWWTNGSAVMILCRKDEPSFKHGPEENPDWFSLPTVKGSK